MTISYRFWKLVHSMALKYDDTMAYMASKRGDDALSQYYEKRANHHKKMLSKLPELLRTIKKEKTEP